MLHYENKAKKDGFTFVIGVDEAGRGPLAGPVVASAVILKKRTFKNRIDDSKKLSPAQREAAFLELCKNSFIGVGIIHESEIDRINILQATQRAMELAISDVIKHAACPVRGADKVCVLIDGNNLSLDVPYRCKTIVRGDSKSLSIAAASICAKVIRDRLMMLYDRLYPDYGFCRHKGYGTKAHFAALKAKGPSLAHRRSFYPMKEIDG